MLFDFLRDITLEMQGIDSKKAEYEREQKRLNKKEIADKEKILIPIWIKKTILIFGMLYLISCIGTLPIIIKSEIILLAIRSILQIVIVIAVLILSNIKKKNAEIAIIILVVIFVLLQNSGLIIIANG